MRRALSFAAFAFLLAVPAAWSQRGGMRGGGMARSAGMFHGAGFVSHAGGTAPMHSVSSGAHHSGFHGCFNCVHSHPHFFYPYAAFGYHYRYPYYGYGYYWPWYGDGSSSYSDDDSTSQREAARQIDDLNQQVQQLRNQLEETQSAQYQSVPPLRASAGMVSRSTDQSKPEKFTAPPDLGTVLVFRDQKIQEVKNYAIIGKVLVVIADQRQRKIPLSDLDLDATSKLNAERGVDFELPR